LHDAARGEGGNPGKVYASEEQKTSRLDKAERRGGGKIGQAELKYCEVEGLRKGTRGNNMKRDGGVSRDGLSRLKKICQSGT